MAYRDELAAAKARIAELEAEVEILRGADPLAALEHYREAAQRANDAWSEASRRYQRIQDEIAAFPEDLDARFAALRTRGERDALAEARARRDVLRVEAAGVDLDGCRRASEAAGVRLAKVGRRIVETLKRAMGPARAREMLCRAVEGCARCEGFFRSLPDDDVMTLGIAAPQEITLALRVHPRIVERYGRLGYRDLCPDCPTAFELPDDYRGVPRWDHVTIRLPRRLELG